MNHIHVKKVQKDHNDKYIYDELMMNVPKITMQQELGNSTDPCST